MTCNCHKTHLDCFIMFKGKKLTRYRVMLCVLWVMIGTLGRIVPHWPNATPLMSLCVIAGLVFDRRFVLLIMIAMLMISDLIVHVVLHLPAFGYWSFFTYSSVCVIALLNSYLLKRWHFSSVAFATIFSVFGFWLWTNLGVWLFSSMYPITINGVLHCYTMALPFLRYHLLGSMFYSVLLYVGVRAFYKWPALSQ